ncbi:hypothetical protein D9758_013381 [Tetrapyrgos nigripes]|uniref:Uncharacterized protein n=1 Tax=Tetrapyrgos nigripes TaxID=182062 RepID=A0A8H5FNE9_9AGAR|nr:hypothetical protein D9758_013381 [Tetrapyrgos nigripes]
MEGTAKLTPSRFERRMSNQDISDNTASVSDHKITLNLRELTEQELALLKSQTDIEDMDELQRHVESVAEKAFKTIYQSTNTSWNSEKRVQMPFSSISGVVVTLVSTLTSTTHIRVTSTKVGHDTRKAIADGYPIQNVVASDIHPEFWTLGHELFKSTPESFPVLLVPGDAFDNAFIPDCPPFDNETRKPSTEKPSQATLASAKSLAPPQGHVSAIHASGLFHLFVEEQQRVLANKLASLLSLEPGSVVFGMQHGASEVKEILNIRKEKTFLHSEDSWTRLWVGEEGESEERVFPKGMVQVDVRLFDLKPTAADGTFSDYNRLVWSVKRI